MLPDLRPTLGRRQPSAGKAADSHHAQPVPQVINSILEGEIQTGGQRPPEASGAGKIAGKNNIKVVPARPQQAAFAANRQRESQHHTGSPVKNGSDASGQITRQSGHEQASRWPAGAGRFSQIGTPKNSIKANRISHTRKCHFLYFTNGKNVYSRYIFAQK